MANLLFFDLPQSQADWNYVTTQANLSHRSLRSCTDLMSGSRVTEEQFILFRTICPPSSNPILFNPATYGLGQKILRAHTMLAQDTDFLYYTANVGMANWLGLGPYRDMLITQWIV